MKAFLKNYRQAPRKVRLVARAIAGKRVGEALAALPFVDKKAAGQLEKVIKSAAANAKSNGVENPNELFIKNITVDEGIKFRRFRARARGSAAPITKRSSHINIELAESMKR